MGRQFAFIINVDNLPSPFLVEIGKRRTLSIQGIRIFEPDVLYCPRTMSPMLRVVNSSDGFEMKYKKVVEESFVKFLKDNRDELMPEVLVSGGDHFWINLAIDAI